jgi:membrane-bound lytic murein transglycosylase D
MSWNRLKSASLKQGQKLVVAQPKVGSGKIKLAKASAKSPARTYTVRKGDTLGGIAKRFKLAAADIQRWNNLSNRQRLQPGTTLIIAPRNG